ncbi:unnamed protein product [Effrenium voratum]|nr:unnamed protein product [Effrenium voratum]CAJ1402837.1 unnamed protein product [Effrenium voratum]
MNRQLAKSFRDGNRSTKPSLPIPLGNSSYSEAFSGLSKRDLRRARQRATVPEQGRSEDSLGFGSKKSSETRSASHHCHEKLPVDRIDTTRQKAKDSLGPRSGSYAVRTTYQESFKPQSAPDYYRPVRSSQVKFSWTEPAESLPRDEL